MSPVWLGASYVHLTSADGILQNVELGTALEADWKIGGSLAVQAGSLGFLTCAYF